MTEAKFYVHIIESPSPADLLDGRTEGTTLCSFLKLAGIPHQYNLAVDLEHFEKAVSDRIIEGIRQFTAIPIIHISAHGNEQGIQLTQNCNSDGFITWSSLSNYLKPIYKAMKELGICLSSCRGGYGKKMARVINQKQVPFGWLVGSSENVSYCDAALAFVAFYRGLQRGCDGASLIASMRAASGVNDFQLYHGHVEQKNYRKLVINKLKKKVDELTRELNAIRDKTN